jgi:hypothetical protein
MPARWETQLQAQEAEDQAALAELARQEVERQQLDADDEASFFVDSADPRAGLPPSWKVPLTIAALTLVLLLFSALPLLRSCSGGH